ncbi:hypothetical protein SAMN04487762_1045 [Polaribacter sp. Hel1_33_78]|nr:hypothetical protein PHEL49_1309 [Polaribacter sp. Hel1_33_49]PKV65281.1 hypothetical protein ATE90_1699 [Polaribacter sp. Hel1_33_96]SDT97738.1 hypothetical protein SAMN04487762_1045 [Polaribacter sp. Hel1_33_78]
MLEVGFESASNNHLFISLIEAIFTILIRIHQHGKKTREVHCKKV